MLFSTFILLDLKKMNFCVLFIGTVTVFFSLSHSFSQIRILFLCTITEIQNDLILRRLINMHNAFNELQYVTILCVYRKKKRTTQTPQNKRTSKSRKKNCTCYENQNETFSSASTNKKRNNGPIFNGYVNNVSLCVLNNLFNGIYE